MPTATTIDYSKLPDNLKSQFAALDSTPQRGKLSKADQAKLNSTQQSQLTKLVAKLTLDQKKAVGLVEAQPPPPSDPSAPRRPKINGLASLPERWYANSWGGISRSVLRNSYLDTSVHATRNEQTGRHSNGHIKVDPPVATADGFRVTVHAGYTQKDEKITLVLNIEAFDPESEELRTLTLAPICYREMVSKDSYDGLVVADFSYADLNAYLKKAGCAARVGPGTPLFVSGLVGKTGHRVGGFGTRFSAPAPLGGGSNPVAAQISAAGASLRPEDIELDMKVPYTRAFTQSIYPNNFANDGAIVSRLESEYKGAATEKQMVDATNLAYALWKKVKAGDTKAVEDIFGPGWTLVAKDRHWLKDDGSPATAESAPGTGEFQGFRVNPKTGWPKIDPMDDVYPDTKDLAYTSIGAAERLRKNDQKGGVYNVKDPGVVDPKTGIRQRCEIGMEFRPSVSMAQVRKTLKAVAKSPKFGHTVYNQAARHMAEIAPDVDFTANKTDLFHVVQERHKFELKNTQTNLSAELSFDFVDVTTMRPEHAGPDGKPQHVHFTIFESELNHLQLSSNHVVESGATSATNQDFAKTEDAQREWLKAASSKVTFQVEPRLHSLADVESGLFRQRPDYKAFEKVNEVAKKQFFPGGMTVASQKANYAAHLLGLAELAA